MTIQVESPGGSPQARTRRVLPARVLAAGSGSSPADEPASRVEEAFAGAGVPVFFGPQQRPLFGWLHSPPPSSARGGVVLCPPLFVEELSSHRALRLLAGCLAARGLVALRLEYDGTGNSAGEEQDPDRVGAWLASVDAARSLLASLLPGAPLGVVGLRMGALLAAAACSTAAPSTGSPSTGSPSSTAPPAPAGPPTAPLQAMVLWDPCATGRDFVREQVALHAVSIGEEGGSAGTAGPAGAAGPAGGAPSAGAPPVEILGSLLSPDLLDALSRLDLAALERPPAEHVLAVVRAERRPRRRVAAALSQWGAEVVAAEGLDRLVDALPDAAAVPTEALATIATWLERSLATGQPAAPAPAPAPAAATPAAATPQAAAPVPVHPVAEVVPGVRERPVRLGRLGLFGIEAAPAGEAVGPTVAFLNAGLIHHVGPSRLWVTLARRLARAGVRSVRLDLSGLGDSPVRPGQRRHVVYPVEALDDLAEVVAALRAENPDGVVLSGLCAGGYHAIEAGLSLPVRGVVPINPFLNFDPEEVREGGDLAQRRGAVKPYRGWIKVLLRFRRLVDLGDRYSPPVLWWLLEKAGLHESPAVPIERLAQRGVLVQLICGDVEARQFTRRGAYTMRRLLRGGSVRLAGLPGTDHTLFGAAGRARACDLLCDHVVSSYATPARAAARDPGRRPGPLRATPAGGPPRRADERPAGADPLRRRRR